MDSGLSIMPTPIYSIQQHSRFTRQDGWRLCDISLCSSGNIAVSGGNYRTNRSFVCIYSTADNSDSRDKPTLLYEKEFEKCSVYCPRSSSFIKPNSTEIVTCVDDNVTVLDYNRDVVLRSRKVNGTTSCLSVSESQIFIALLWSDIVNIYDIDLNRIKSIKLKEVRGQGPIDISAVANRLYVCTYTAGYMYGRAAVYSQTSGTTLRVYNKRVTRNSPNKDAYSITVSVHLGVVILLNQNQIVFHNVSEKKSFLTVKVESAGVSRIRISDQGRIVTGDGDTGEVKIYDLASILTFTNLKNVFVSMFERKDCEKLIKFFAMAHNESDTIMNNDTPPKAFLLALEEKGVIHPSNVERLEEAFIGLKMGRSFCQVVNVFQKTRDQTTSYDRFVATLSPHLTSSVQNDLCDYFNISDEKKASITSSHNPGLFLLLALHEMNIIKPSEVGALEQPFTKFKLVQAVAKIHEYQLILEEEKNPLQRATYQTLEDKRILFLECLKKKMKSWYETMTPVPWKKSCQWKSTDLFVGSGLVLTDSKTKRSVTDIDEQCKLKHTEIFTHEKLKSESRIILEGDPGAGKTMLSSQLAYDWSEGNISDVDILIFLPLKFVEDKTFIQAIKEFYIPSSIPVFENDVEAILASETEKICLLLDGLEEYGTGGRMRTKESSEVMKVMKKEKHSNCKVVITSRSDFAHDLPECPLLKLGRFGENERNMYIEKLSPEDTDKQQKIKRVIQDNPFILDLCSVPLLFVLAAHNIECMSLSEESQLNKVAPFMRSMIVTLCSSSTVKHEVDGIRSKFFKSEKMTLGELAFNGLCKGHQQLSWQKEFMESNVGNFKQWVDSGVLVLEEGIVTTEKKETDFSDIRREEEKKEKKKKRRKKKEKEKRTTVQGGQDEGKIESTLGDSSQVYNKGKQKDGKPKEKKKKKKKKEKKEKADELPVLTDDMLTAEFPEPSATYGIPKLPSIYDDLLSRPSTSYEIPDMPEVPEEILTTILSKSSTNSDLPEMKECEQSVSEHQSNPHVKKEKTVPTTANQVPLVVKFLHKVIQEWFAATFFCSMMRRCTSTDQFHNYVSNQLCHITPTDLHYILRFSCYLHPPSCHVIMNYLLRSYRKDGRVPLHIMNCVFLCFNEHNDVKGSDMRKTVTEICKEVVTIQSEDSRLLQQAKLLLLKYAASEKVIIEKLELEDVIFAVDKTTLVLNSGVQLGALDTLKVIEVSRWDQVLQEEDFNNILKHFSKGTSVKEIFCTFPSQPPESLDEITLGNIVSKNLRVEWNIGHFVQTLDPIKGKWMISFKQPGASSTKAAQVCTDQVETEEEIHVQQPTTSSFSGTSADASKQSHTQETPKRTGSDSVTDVDVPNKKAKIAQEESPAGDVEQMFTLDETPLSGDESRIILDKVAPSVNEETVVQEEVAANNVEKIIMEENAASDFEGNAVLDETSASDSGSVEQQTNLEEAPVSSDIVQRILPEEAAVNSNEERFGAEDTALRGVAQRVYPEDVHIRGDMQWLEQDHPTVNGALEDHVPVHHNQFLLQAQAVITQSGGEIEIPYTGVVLRIPPNALPEDRGACLIQMRIIPVSMSNDGAVSFSSNSSMRVELLPNHFKFRCHVELTMPHCLELKRNVLHRARIFMSHHNEGERPQWEEQIEQFYQLLETMCVVWIKGFCWIKCEIDDEIVEAKRLKIYTAARKMYLEDKYAVVEVGYHLDMPGEQQILKMNPGLILADSKPFLFLREGKESLFVHFIRIVPHQWKYRDQNPKKITFHNIAASVEQTCQFMVEKETQNQEIPMCFFVASQRHHTVERTVEVMIRPEAHPFATPWDVR